MEEIILPSFAGLSDSVAIGTRQNTVIAIPSGIEQGQRVNVWHHQSATGVYVEVTPPDGTWQVIGPANHFQDGDNYSITTYLFTKILNGTETGNWTFTHASRGCSAHWRIYDDAKYIALKSPIQKGLAQNISFDPIDLVTDEVLAVGSLGLWDGGAGSNPDGFTRVFNNGAFRLLEGELEPGVNTGTTFDNGNSGSAPYTLMVAMMASTAIVLTPPYTPAMWPTKYTTGVQSGITLTNYTGSMTVSVNGTVIENKIITGQLEIHADNVTIRNCKFNGISASYQLLNEANVGLLVEYCTFEGLGSSKMQAIQTDGGTVQYCNISGMVIGIRITKTATIRHNYIHDLAELSQDIADRHFDGIVCLIAAGKDSIIHHNAIVMPTPQGGTAAVFLSTQFGPGQMTNVSVTDNLMLGAPSFAGYAESSTYGMSGVVYDGNYMQRGDYDYILNTSGATDTRNTKWIGGVDPTPQPVLDWIAANT